MDYTVVKIIHVACAVISITGFVARGILAIQQSTLLTRRWIKIVPHIIDTLLLISAVLLVIQLAISPLAHAWLMMKIVLLLLYIFLGLLTLRLAKTRQTRVIAFFTAILVFAYIVAIAESKSLVFF